jgi:hypothetical protein
LLWVTRCAGGEAASPFSPAQSRRTALRIFISHGRIAERSPRTILHALHALACLDEHPEILRRTSGTAEALKRELDQPLPQPVSSLLLELQQALAQDSPASHSVRTALAESLECLRSDHCVCVLRSPLPAPAWMDIDEAGLLLLVPIVIRLRWDRLRTDARFLPWGGVRFFQAMLAGIGTAALDRLTPGFLQLSPAASLFAGLGPDPDLIGIRQALNSCGPTDYARLLKDLIPGTCSIQASSDGLAACEELANRLIAEFTSLIPGFRQARRPAVLRQFLQTRGRVQIEEHQINVQLDPSPFHVALHMAMLDSPLAAVSWMGDRPLKFHLAGL